MAQRKQIDSSSDAAIGRLVRAILMEPPDVVARLAQELEIDDDVVREAREKHDPRRLLEPYTPRARPRKRRTA